MVQRKKKPVFTCRHCDREFSSRHALGGHASKVHPGMSEKNAHKVRRRIERTKDRTIHAIAKDIYAEMKAGTLSDLMRQTFKWKRNRRTEGEKQLLIVKSAGMEMPLPTEEEAAAMKKRDKLSDKGRVRRLIEKVWHVLSLPLEEIQKLVSPDYIDRF